MLEKSTNSLFIKLDNCKAVSTNALYKGMGKSRSKTKQYKYLTQVAKFEILKINREVKRFVSSFDPLVHTIKVTVYNELSNLIIKKSLDKERIGRVSLTCLDVDNSFKGLIDSIFNQIGLNDAEIQDLRGYKFQSEENCNNIYIELETVDREELCKTLKKYLSKNIQAIR